MEKLSTMLVTCTFMLLVSCSVDAMQDKFAVEGEHGFNFKESKSAWKELKKKNGNSYEYTVLEQSWTGHGSETIIVVKNGKVTSRHYTAFEISDEDGTKNITDSYEENQKREIGSHSSGAPPYTIDKLYNTCLSKYLTVDHEANNVYFETNEQGVMMLCGYEPIGCQDDCFKGIRISEFRWK